MNYIEIINVNVFQSCMQKLKKYLKVIFTYEFLKHVQFILSIVALIIILILLSNDEFFQYPLRDYGQRKLVHLY